ncbi:MAG: winged helix-turn-helix transcriptional regulator [Chloroflexi bacterium]|nr:winged helix-turn-helix transcriptional regulator [Chloroflexota bacterium]
MRKHSDHGGHHHLRPRDLQLPNEQDMLNVTRIFQALSDLTRAKVIFALTQGERSVNEIAVVVGASPSSVSHHLRRLRDAGLVEYHRHGNQIFYSIEDIHIAAILEEAQHHTEHTYPVVAPRAKRK